jgi:hypothetical protein
MEPAADQAGAGTAKPWLIKSAPKPARKTMIQIGKTGADWIRTFGTGYPVRQIKNAASVCEQLVSSKTH